ncbi:MAG: putative bifunctional diguanylate cyclase/phosphodiesterase [Actinomycetota bacterium]
MATPGTAVASAGIPAIPRPARMARGRRRFALATAAAAAGIVAFAFWCSTSPDSEPSAIAGVGVADIVTTTAALVAAGACVTRARGETQRNRIGWTLLAGATLAWGLGNAIWMLYEPVTGEAPRFPSVADATYFLAPALALAAVMLFPTTPAGVLPRPRSIVDGLLIAGSLLFASWALVIGPVIDATPTFPATAFAIAVADVVLGTTVLIVASRATRGGRVPLAILTPALLALAVADSCFASVRARGDAGVVDLVHVAGLTGFLLLALAAIRPAPLRASEDPDRRHPGVALLPYAPLPLAVAVAGYQQITTGGLEGFLVWNGVAIGVLLAARQMITLLENTSLARDFEAKVAARTVEVEEKAAALRAGEERTRLILETANDAFIGMDADGRVIAWNRCAEQTFGWPAREVMGRQLADSIIPPRDRQAHQRGLQRFLATGESTILNRPVELTAVDREGREFPIELTIWSIRVGRTRTFNAFVRDISERKEFEEQLSHQALHDPLTGLPNRTLFHDRLAHSLLRAERHPEQPVSVLFLDLDAFKTVNDSLGHSTGDELLQAVGQRLRAAMRADDTVARLGGDEFAILLDGTEPIDEQLVARRIKASLDAPFVMQGKEVFVRASVGIATSTGAEQADDLVRNADVAMYQAKSAGRSGYEVFEDRMHTAMVERLELEADLRRALDNEELVLHYQPVIALESNRITGVETLVRWQHPRRGLVFPGEFIPTAEETGLIVPMGRWILEHACRQARSWHEGRPGEQPLSLTVNLSARQVQDPDVVADVEAILSSTGIDPQHVVLELTESVLMEDTEQTIVRLTELKELGVRLAIDDFGTGYSSLSYLHRFPIDVLKIDQSFVRNIPSGAEEMALMRTIVKLGETFALATVAEGIERLEQLDELREMGCQFGQGFYFSKAVPAASLDAMLGEPAPAPAQAQPA